MITRIQRYCCFEHPAKYRRQKVFSNNNQSLNFRAIATIEIMTDSKSGTNARRLSFAGEDSSNAGKSSQQQSTGGGPSATGGGPAYGGRKQSIWNAGGGGGGGTQRTGAGGGMPGGRRLSYSMSHSSRKSSQDLGYPRVRLQNTYRMEPVDSDKFKPYKIEPKIYALLEQTLKNKKYEANKAASLSKELSQEMMRETRLIMNANSMRYKLVSHVVVGEMNGQDLRVGSRCLWDNNLDNCVSVVYKNNSLYAVVTVYAIYFE